MDRKVVTTKDGSSTIFVPSLDEHYHSIHGALQESRHIFIEAGFRAAASNKKELDILEIGLGTGLNALLTNIEAEKTPCNVHYTSLEKYPVTDLEWHALNFADKIDDSAATAMLDRIHAAPWETWEQVSPHFQLKKYRGDLLEFRPDSNFDLIYFDAFAPSAQPELWSLPVFQTMFQSLKPGGTLVTYCVKGDVRRNMQAAGFEVKKIPGPPGKREMARATKPS